MQVERCGDSVRMEFSMEEAMVLKVACLRTGGSDRVTDFTEELQGRLSVGISEWLKEDGQVK